MRVDQYQNDAGENRSFTKCHVNTLNVLDSARTAEEGASVNTEVEKPSKPTANKPAKPAKPGVKKPAVSK